MTMSSSPRSTILLKPFVNDIISCFPKSLGIHPNHAFSANVNSSLTAPDEHQVDHCIFPGNWSWIMGRKKGHMIRLVVSMTKTFETEMKKCV